MSDPTPEHLDGILALQLSMPALQMGGARSVDEVEIGGERRTVT